MQLCYATRIFDYSDPYKPLDTRPSQRTVFAWRIPSVAPSLRYYTQSAADFYFDPPYPQGYAPGQDYTADTRLSGFGAFTPAITITKSFTDGWSAELKFAFYRQRASWKVGGDGSPGLDPFSARWIEAGIARSF